MAPTVTLTKQQPLMALKKNNVKLPKLCIRNVLKPGVHIQQLPSTITFLEQLYGTTKERQQKTSAFQPIIIASENQPQIKTLTVTTKEKQIESQLLQPKSIEQQATKNIIQQPQQIANPIPVKNANEIMLSFDSTDELLLVKEEPEVMEAQDITLIPDLLEDSPPPGKKRRLEGLTYEQKAYRKKLKNRLAAQNSRDRKKAKVEELEKSIVSLSKENAKLVEENKTLEERNKSLVEEVKALRSSSQALQEELERIKGSQSKCSCGSNSNPVTVVECTDSTLGSAAGWTRTDDESPGDGRQLERAGSECSLFSPPEGLTFGLPEKEWLSQFDLLVDPILDELSTRDEGKTSQLCTGEELQKSAGEEAKGEANGQNHEEQCVIREEVVGPKLYSKADEDETIMLSDSEIFHDLEAETLKLEDYQQLESVLANLKNDVCSEADDSVNCRRTSSKKCIPMESDAGTYSPAASPTALSNHPEDMYLNPLETCLPFSKYSIDYDSIFDLDLGYESHSSPESDITVDLKNSFSLPVNFPQLLSDL